MVRNKVEVDLALRDRLSQPMRRADGAVRGLTARVGALARKFGPLIGAAGIAGTAFAATRAVKAFADLGDQMQKMALRTGVSTESLSQLRFAAEISGTSIESLENGLKRAARTLVDANDGLSTAVRAFEQAGIQIKDTEGKLKSVDTVLLEFADAMQRVETDTEKAALAQQIFGRAGTQLLPLLKSGRAGIEELRKEADRLGLTFSQDMADASADFNDSLTRVNSAFQGLRNTMARDLLPSVTPLIERFAVFISRNRDLTVSILKVAGAIVGTGGLLVAFAFAGSAVLSLITAFGALGGPVIAGVIAGLTALGFALSQIPSIKDKLDQFKSLEELSGRLAEKQKVLAGAEKELRDIEEGNISTVRRVLDGFTDREKSIRVHIASLKEDIKALEANIGKQKQFKESMDKLTASQKASEKAAAKAREELEKVSTTGVKAGKAFSEAWEFTANRVQDSFFDMTRDAENFFDFIEQKKPAQVFRDNWKFTAEHVQDSFFDMTRDNKDFQFKVKRENKETTNVFTETWDRAHRAFRGGFSDAIFNTITGRFNRLKDVGLAVADALARAFADMVTQILIDLARLALFRFFGIGTGGGFNFGGGGVGGGLLNAGVNAGVSQGISSLFGGGGSAAAGGTAGVLSTGAGTGLTGAVAGPGLSGGGILGPAGFGGVGGGTGAAAASGGAGSAAAGAGTGALAAAGVIGPAVGVAAGIAFFTHSLLTQKPTPKLIELAGGDIARLGSLASFRVFSSLPTFFPENLVAPPTPAELEAGLRFNQQSVIASSNVIGNALAHIAPPNVSIPTAEGLWRQVFLEFAEQADPNAPVHPFVSDLVSRITFAARGFSGFVNRPTLFMAGEGAGSEFVNITPTRGGRSGGIRGMLININFNAPVTIRDERDAELLSRELARRIDLESTVFA